MGGSTYNARKNEISYKGYIALGGVNNAILYAMQRYNGTHHYTTYHIGVH